MSTILIAYERETESSMLDELLTARGHKVTRSSNGIEALDAARREPPQLVVSDILLPKMDGFALCRKWKQDERLQSIPFIFFTTRHDDPKYERFAQELKADRFLARPSEPDALLKAVDQLLAVAKARGTGTERLPVLNDANLRLSAQVVELQAQSRRLAESESTFRKAFEASPCPLWVVENDSRRHALVNDAALKLLGYARAEFLLLTAGALDAPADAPPLPPGMHWQRRKDGQLLALQMDTQPIELGGRSAAVVAACDLTEHAETAAGLREDLARQQAVLDALTDGYCLVDAEGRFLEVNPAYCRLSGYTREELLKLTLSDLALGGAGNDTIRLQLQQAGNRNSHASKQRRKSGVPVDVEITTTAITGYAGLRVLIVRDVSTQQDAAAGQRLAELRLAALLELQQSGEAVDETALIRRAVEQAASLTGSPLALCMAVTRDGKSASVVTCFTTGAGHAEGSPSSARPMTRASLWAEAAKSGSALLDNSASKKTQLEGMPDITRCIVVPLVEGDDPPLLFAVGNRDREYGDADKQDVALLASGLWRALKVRRAYSHTLSALQRADVAMEALIDTLSRVGEAHDPHTAGSAARVAVLAVALARELGLDGEKQHALRLAGLLHDIGSTVIPAGILAKPGKLTEPEKAMVKLHPEAGRQLLAGIDFNAPVAEMVHQHHERLDGSGYPRALKGDEILLEARILAVADVVEAMCSRRASRASLGIDAALDEINGNAGRLYDPHVVAACVRLFRQHGFSLPG